MGTIVSELKLEAGKFYRGKKPRRMDDGGYNDRYVLYISKDGRQVQYDSPTINNGRNYPFTPTEKFLLWAGKEITSEEYMNTKPVISKKLTPEETVLWKNAVQYGESK